MTFGRVQLAFVAACGLAPLLASGATAPHLSDEHLIDLLSSGVATDEVARIAGCPDTAALDAYLSRGTAAPHYAIVSAPFDPDAQVGRHDLATPLAAERAGLVATPFRFSSAFTNSPFQAAGSASSFESGRSFSARPLGGRFGRLDDPFNRPSDWPSSRQ